MADQVIAVELQGVGKRANVIGAGVGAVVQLRAGGRQAATAHVQHVGVEVQTQAFRDKTPGNRRAGDTGNQDQCRALAAVTQVMLADTIGLDVAAIEKAAHAATPDFSCWA